MKAFFILCCFSLLSFVVFAQNAKIDSLKKVIETTKVDTVKGRSLCRLCAELSDIGEMESGLKGGQEGLRILQKRKDRSGVAYCFNRIGIHYDINGNYPLAIDYYQKSRDLYLQIGDTITATDPINNLGGVYYFQGLYGQALFYFQQSLKLQEKQNYQIGMSVSLNNIGLLFFTQDNYPMALTYQLKSLKIKEQLGLKKELAFSYINIGNIYFAMHDDAKALAYFNRAIEISKVTADEVNLAKSVTLIGDLHDSEHRYDSALACYQKSLNIYQRLKNKYEISACLTCIAMTYKRKKEYAQSFRTYMQALAISKEINDKTGITEVYLGLGNLYFEQKNFMEAQRFVNDAYRLTDDKFNIDTKTDILFSLYQIDSALGDWKSAFEHHKLYKQYSDSLHNEDKSKAFGRIESRYQFEKEAEEAKRKEAEAKRKEQAETERRNNLQYLSIFAGLMVLFGGLAFVGKLKIPVRVLDIALFASLLILFEFLLILSEPYIEQFSGGIPIQKLVFNSVIALGFAPLHGFLEGKLKKRFSSR